MTEEILAPGQSLPMLELREASGGTVRTWDYRGRRPLVLFLAHGPGCERCEAAVEELAAGYGRITALGAELLAILPAGRPDAAEWKGRKGIPFPVLADVEGRASARFGGGAAVVVADRYGEIFAIDRADGGHRLLDLEGIVGWLDFIGLQCPE